MIISSEYLYWAAGTLLLITSLIIARDRSHPRRGWSALFWADLGLLFIAADRMPPVLVGCQVAGLTLIVALGGLQRGRTQSLPAAERRASAQRLRSKLLLPLLALPIITIYGSVGLKNTKIGSFFLLDQNNQTLAALGVACVVAVLLACWLTRDTAAQSIHQSRELTDTVGWTLVLPQMLAMLGAMFAHTGVGDSIAYLAKAYVATDTRWIVVSVYSAGMAVFAMIMGGGGASFPLMAGGIGVPILIGQFHGNPAVIAALGMFSAYVGTLMTPMAAHFNLIPVALLELPDKYAVIRAQVPTALWILVANTVLLYYLM
jgi:uncharacterized membrane protein